MAPSVRSELGLHAHPHSARLGWRKHLAGTASGLVFQTMDIGKWTVSSRFTCLVPGDDDWPRKLPMDGHLPMR